MLLTFSEIIKQAAVLCRLEEPTGTLFSSTDKDVKVLHLALVEIGRMLRSRYIFRQLIKTHTMTVSADDVQHPLPGDFFRFLPFTQWDQTNAWKMYGPVSDSMWNLFQYGAVSSITRKRFLVRGANTDTGQFFLDPEPEANDVLSYDYIRSQFIFPKAWAASEAVTSGTTYRSANGNIYLAQTTASTGATRPSHTTGTASDGTVSWLYVATQLYGSNQRFQADDDFPLFDGDLCVQGTVWKFKELSSFAYESFRIDWEKECKRRATRLGTSGILNLAEGGATRLIGGDNVPEGNFG